MSIWPRRLRTRLFASYVVVVLAGSAAMLLVGTVVTRTVYERQLGGFGFGRGAGRGSQVSEAELQTALDESLWPALLAGAGAALLAAMLVASILGRRILRPIDELRAAARQMAAGDYSVQVPVPTEIELASLADDVNQLGAHLAATEQRRTRLLSEVTHELRTPITVIRGHMEGLIDGVIEPSDEVYVTIVDEAARMQRLVDDLSMLSRADEGTLDLDLADLDIGALAAVVADRLRPQFDHEHVVLQTVRPDSPITVRGDADRLMQVFANLLGNALGHTPAGGSVTIRTGRDDGVAWVDVTDTGSGVPEGEQERIFERFYRGAGTATGRPARAGRGIGLTIARSLARAHGGDVRVSAAKTGAGATFRVTIPAR